MTDETQVETPIEDAPVLPVETQDADSSPAAEAATPNEKADESGKDKVQKRFDQLTWEREQARREAEYYRSLALQQQPQPEAPRVEAKLPTLEEHGYDEAKYQAALIQYATSQAERVVEARLSQAEQQRMEQVRLSSFAERQREFAKATPDFEAKVLRDPTLPISETMRDVIVDSPAGPEVAYYLASNRDVAEQIAQLPPHLAALELGRIEGRLTASKASKPPQISKAPPPPPRIEEASVPVAGVKASDPESDRLSDAEWMRLRNKEVKRRKL